MMKICPRCAGTFAGGSFCPGCGVRQPLIDMSSRQALPYLEDADMRRAAQTHYVERSRMLRTALGMLIAVHGGPFIARSARRPHSAHRRIPWVARVRARPP